MLTKQYEKLFSEFSGVEDELIPILQKVQNRFGFISEKSTGQISKFLKISENQIYGVASFYSQFRFTEPGRNVIKVCMGTACHVRGGEILCDAIERELGIFPGETTPDMRYEFQRVACLGCCALAPVVQINDDVYSQMTVVKLQEILKAYE